MDIFAFNPEIDLELDKVIAASPANVWRCLTEPALIEQWFCPKPWEAHDVVLEPRPGGAFHTPMRGPNGEANGRARLHPGGRARAAPRLHRRDGPRLPPDRQRRFMTGSLPARPVEAGTRLTARALHADPAARAQHDEMGFYVGWNTATRSVGGAGDDAVAGDTSAPSRSRSRPGSRSRPRPKRDPAAADLARSPEAPVASRDWPGCRRRASPGGPSRGRHDVAGRVEAEAHLAPDRPRSRSVAVIAVGRLGPGDRAVGEDRVRASRAVRRDSAAPRRARRRARSRHRCGARREARDLQPPLAIDEAVDHAHHRERAEAHRSATQAKPGTGSAMVWRAVSRRPVGALAQPHLGGLCEAHRDAGAAAGQPALGKGADRGRQIGAQRPPADRRTGWASARAISRENRSANTRTTTRPQRSDKRNNRSGRFSSRTSRIAASRLRASWPATALRLDQASLALPGGSAAFLPNRQGPPFYAASRGDSGPTG